ncbi:hypothetical protein GCM10010246_73490 [Streptomyces cuspidosporus]|uniref:Uncharacterized protein n=1 Tax=Streptomyces cuspidosporus TaxID=66882 RepID=A0ABN3H4Q4_9ACTN
MGHPDQDAQPLSDDLPDRLAVDDDARPVHSLYHSTHTVNHALTPSGADRVEARCERTAHSGTMRAGGAQWAQRDQLASHRMEGTETA